MLLVTSVSSKAITLCACVRICERLFSIWCVDYTVALVSTRKLSTQSVSNTCVHDRFAGNWLTWLQMLACAVLRTPKIIFVCFCTCIGMLLTKGIWSSILKQYRRATKGIFLRKPLRAANVRDLKVQLQHGSQSSPEPRTQGNCCFLSRQSRPCYAREAIQRWRYCEGSLSIGSR